MVYTAIINSNSYKQPIISTNSPPKLKKSYGRTANQQMQLTALRQTPNYLFKPTINYNLSLLSTLQIYFIQTQKSTFFGRWNEFAGNQPLREGATPAPSKTRGIDWIEMVRPTPARSDHRKQLLSADSRRLISRTFNRSQNPDSHLNDRHFSKIF